MKKKTLVFITFMLPLLAISTLVSAANMSSTATLAAEKDAVCQNSITVMNNNSSGAGSLRQAIADVCEGGLITFDSALDDSTVDISADGELVITQSLSISSTIPITISGNHSTRVLNIQEGSVTIDQLIIANGNVQTNDCGPYGDDICGGGIIIQADGTAVISNSTLINNTARFGGGISNFGTLTVKNCVFWGNTAIIGGGGIDNNGTAIMKYSTLSNNSSEQVGGGVLTDVGLMDIQDSTISANEANFSGGGIYAHNKIAINNSTVSGNTAQLAGGIFVAHEGTLTVTQSTVTNNSSDRGSGAGIVSTANSSTSTMVSYSIVSGNVISGTNMPSDLGLTTDGDTDSFISGGHNLLGVVDENVTAFVASGDQIDITEALLDSLADNGRLTQTHALLPGSPAIDGGGSCSAMTDQRGVERPQGAACDIGAFESQGFELTGLSGNAQTTGINSTFAIPLALSISSGFNEPVVGGQLIFSAPVNGAGVTFTETAVTIDDKGTASLSVTANDQMGSYPVTATAKGNFGEPVIFNLTNSQSTFLPIVLKAPAD